MSRTARTAALAAAAILLPAAAGQSVSSTSVAGLSEGPEPELLHHNLLVILADDMSIDTLPLYGLDPTVPPDLTPCIDALAAHGVVFVNAYTNPVCSASRAQLLTGEHAHRTGIGTRIESAPVSLPLDAVTLPEVLRTLAPAPYDTAAFGKWHLQKKYGSAPCPPLAHGFDTFGGTLLALSPVSAYCDWDELVCPAAVTVNHQTYMPAQVVDRAIEWIAQRERPWFCYLAPQAPYESPHVPPAALQSVVQAAACQDCSLSSRSCWNADLQALDTKVGALVASLGPEWWTHTTIVFTADNGTPNEVNTYWPKGAKGNLTEGGTRVPMIVAGRAVAEGRRGSTEDALVQVIDLFRMLAREAGVHELPAGIARDSIDLGPLLADPPGASARAYAWAETFWPNSSAGPPYQKHVIAVRDARYKLEWDESNQLARNLYDLWTDPFELTNLLTPGPPGPETPEGQAYLDLLAQVAQQLGS